MRDPTTSSVASRVLLGAVFTLLFIILATDASAANVNYSEDSLNFGKEAAAKSRSVLHRLLNWADEKKDGDDEKNSEEEAEEKDEDSEKELISDRPSFTEGSSPVGYKNLQIEGGYTYTQAADGIKGHDTHDLPEFLMRYGLAERLELRVIWEGVVFDSVSNHSTGRVATDTGITDVDIGFKYGVTKQRDWLPETALIVSVSVPSGSRSQSSYQVDAEVVFAYGWDITKRLWVGGRYGQPQHERNRMTV